MIKWKRVKWKNFVEMPYMMQLIVTLAITAPFIAIGSVLTGQIAPNHISSSSFGAADNIFELILVVTFSMPVMYSGFLMVMKLKISRYAYIGGSLLICVSPLALTAIRSQLDIFLVESFFYVFIILVIAGYFFISKEVKRYFDS